MSRRAQPDLVTDWIPCTTPPVRDGVYELQTIKTINESSDKIFQPVCSGFKYGKWDININATYWCWRGVRRWVLQGPADNFLAHFAREPVDIYLESSRPHSAKWNSLAKARPFRTEAAAQRFAARFSHLGLTAVLP